MSESEQFQSPVEWAVRRLTQQIASCKYQPGEMLPGERILAEEMKIGRGSVRAALLEIENRGLVRRRPGRGTEVVLVAQRGVLPRIVTVHPHFGAVNSPEFSAIHLGILDRLKSRGYASDHIYVTNKPSMLEEGPAFEGIVTLPEGLGAHLERYEAVLFQEIAETEQVALELERQHRPVVVANLEQDIALSATRVDHAKVFFETTKILLNFGHRRIAFVGRDPQKFFHGRAVAGYRQALEAAKVPVDEALIVRAKASDAFNGYLASRELLRGDDRPTAIVAARDVLAQGVCHAIEEAGLCAGSDVSVVSYDNLSWPMKEPFLTTFNEPAYEMGTTAVDMLLERLIGGWKPVEQRTLEARLVLRRSAAPPKVSVPVPVE